VANDTDAVGLLLQELPTQEHQEASWEHITLLANTLTEQELLTLNCEDLLYRLFHEEKVRLFAPEAVEFACSCSRERIERTLRAMDKAELNEILQERGQIEVICEFCGQHNHFDAIDIASLFSQHGVSTDSQTRH
jgi:molecular chaperone Hsp33